MKINELKNIIPLKYNSFYSVHKSKNSHIKSLKNLPNIKTFSRNFNKELNKIQFTLTQENYSNQKNIIHSNSINNTNELVKNNRNMPQSNYFRLTNYIRNKYAKNITKTKNKISSSNKVKEIKFNVNKTEYNNFNDKCFRLNVLQYGKPKTEHKFMKKNYILSVDEIYNIQKEDFKKKINSEMRRNEFINNYSSIIYYQIFPQRMRNKLLSKENIPNIFNQYILKNLKETSPKHQQDSIIKENSFIEMILENVTHKVEYKNQKNERITIGLVKNLLYEEIERIESQLNLKLIQNSTKYNNESRINKSTSTNDFQNSKFLKLTYDKFSHRNTNLEDKIEGTIKRKIGKKLYELNEKYDFLKGSDNVLLNMRIISEDNHDKYKRDTDETENNLKIKSKRKQTFNDEEEGNKLGDFIWNIAEDINDLEDYKKRNYEIEKGYIFQNTKIKNVFDKLLFNKNNNKNDILRLFTMNNYTPKKNINFNGIQNNILQSDSKNNTNKELEQKKQLVEKSIQSPSKRKKTEEINIINTSPNKLNKEKEKENMQKRKMRISTNLNFDNLLSILNDNQQYEQLINGFGGYYTENTDKEILTKIKESNPNKSNIAEIYNEIQTNIITKQNEKKISKIKSYNINNNPKPLLLNKLAETYHNDSSKIKILESDNNDKEKDYDKTNRDENNNNTETNNTKRKGKKNVKNKIRKRNITKEMKNRKEKVNDKNNEIEEKNKEIFEENSYIEENKKIDNDITTEQEKKDNESNKNIYDKEIKNLNDDINNKISKTNKKKNKFNINHAKMNKNLNDLEKDFIIQTNFLSDLNEKDKEQILKYFEELEETSEIEMNISSSIYLKNKINNIHYLIKNFILSILKQINIKDNKSAEQKENERKRKTEIFNSMKSKEFFKKQSKIFQLKQEEEEQEQNILQILKKKIEKRNKFDIFDKELEIIFEKSMKRSRSFNIKIMSSYPKLYHNLLFNVFQGKESLSRAHTPKKKIKEDEWQKYLMKTSIHRRNKFNFKISKFVKRKRKANKNARKSLFIDEYKLIKDKNKIEEKDEELEDIKDEIKRIKLKKELKEKKLYEFFDRIQALKKGGLDNFAKELEVLVDKELDKMEYTREKENESRVNNFIQEFDINRNKIIFVNKFRSKKMHFLSPINFFTK